METELYRIVLKGLNVQLPQKECFDKYCDILGDTSNE